MAGSDQHQALFRSGEPFRKLLNQNEDIPAEVSRVHGYTREILQRDGEAPVPVYRAFAEDPHGFILRQGWSGLDFSEDVELVQLRRLYETLQLEIVNVLEALGTLRESPDYELCQIGERKPGVLDELASQRAELLDKESAELEAQAGKLAAEIEELGGAAPGVRQV
ncbi:MAG: hypothetical protein ACOYOU_21190 [Kiritimatiellia bacterium]